MVIATWEGEGVCWTKYVERVFRHISCSLFDTSGDMYLTGVQQIGGEGSKVIDVYVFSWGVPGFAPKNQLE